MKKKPVTPRSRIRSTLRRLWLQSRERAIAVKRSENRCECCGELSINRKGGTVKLEVHHNDEIGKEWDSIIDKIYRHILVDPQNLTVFCQKCHKEHHDETDRFRD